MTAVLSEFNRWMQLLGEIAPAGLSPYLNHACISYPHQFQMMAAYDTIKFVSLQGYLHEDFARVAGQLRFARI